MNEVVRHGSEGVVLLLNGMLLPRRVVIFSFIRDLSLWYDRLSPGRLSLTLNEQMELEGILQAKLFSGTGNLVDQGAAPSWHRASRVSVSRPSLPFTKHHSQICKLASIIQSHGRLECSMGRRTLTLNLRSVFTQSPWGPKHLLKPIS